MSEINSTGSNYNRVNEGQEIYLNQVNTTAEAKAKINATKDTKSAAIPPQLPSPKGSQSDKPQLQQPESAKVDSSAAGVESLFSDVDCFFALQQAMAEMIQVSGDVAVGMNNTNIEASNLSSSMIGVVKDFGFEEASDQAAQLESQAKQQTIQGATQIAGGAVSAAGGAAGMKFGEGVGIAASGVSNMIQGAGAIAAAHEKQAHEAQDQESATKEQTGVQIGQMSSSIAGQYGQQAQSSKKSAEDVLSQVMNLSAEWLRAMAENTKALFRG